MNARTKLNTAYFYWALILASVIGAVTDSGLIFCLALTIFVGASIYNHGIRFKTPRR